MTSKTTGLQSIPTVSGRAWVFWHLGVEHHLISLNGSESVRLFTRVAPEDPRPWEYGHALACDGRGSKATAELMRAMITGEKPYPYPGWDGTQADAERYARENRHPEVF